MVGDESLEHFRVEYEKLLRALRKSHDKERKLVKKAKEQNAELIANAAKVQAALRLSEEDQQMVAALKKEVETAWAEVDEVKEKESTIREQYQSVKAELANMVRDAEDPTRMTIVDEEMTNLLKEKADIADERDHLLEAVVKLRSTVSAAQEAQRNAEKDREAMRDETNKTRQYLREREKRDDTDKKKMARVERNIQELELRLENKDKEIRSLNDIIRERDADVRRAEMNLHEAEISLDRTKRESNQLTEKTHRMQHDISEQMAQNTSLLTQLSQQQLELRAKEEENQNLKAQYNKSVKLRETAHGKLQQAERAHQQVEAKRESVLKEKKRLEMEIEQMSSEITAVQKKHAEVSRERDVIFKKKAAAENLAGKKEDEVRIIEVSKRSLEEEIDAFKAEILRVEMQKSSVEKERARFAREAEEARAKYVQALEEVKQREVVVQDLQKKLVEGDSRMKQQQNLYEAVRSDRNMYSKNLVEAQDEVSELKRKMKVTNHQIDQLKELIKMRDWSLTTALMSGQALEKRVEQKKIEMSKMKDTLDEKSADMEQLKRETNKLESILREAEHERSRMRKEYEVVVNERDILGTQLIRRNDELALLYEKVKIQQSTLLKGQVQYRDRVGEIRVLKLKLSDLKREVGVLRSSVQNIDILKREVHHLSRELLRERAKLKALSEELETPMNVHRWRKLEGSDPATFEMIQKVQTLQRRLIAKTEEVVGKDLVIQEKERLYLELKNILARQPGPEAAEKVSVYRANLKEKSKQMKAMASELNMLQAQTNEYKYEIERLVRELNDTKKKYFETRRALQLDRTGAAGAGTGPLGNSINKGAQGPVVELNMSGTLAGGPGAERPRFVGGGFSLQA